MKARIVAFCVVIVALIGASVWFLWPKNTLDPGTGTPSQQVSNNAPYVQLNILQSDLKQTNGKLKVGIQSSDLEDIVKVEYLLDARLAAQSTVSPFAVVINVSGIKEGDHTVQAVAYNAAGQSGKSEKFTFTVAPGEDIEPADASSQAVVYQSLPRAKLASASKGGTTNNNGNGNSGGSSGGTSENPLPETPPAEICGNSAILNGPSSAPAGAVVVSAGDNSSVDFTLDNTTYWFAPGTHMLGNGQFSQIVPGDNATFIGGPGAIIDGQGINNYAFSGKSTNVKIQYLTIKNFTAPRDEGVVNHNSGVGWTIEYTTAEDNPNGGAVFAGTNNVVRYNCLKDNGQYGFQVFSDDVGGPQNVILDHNEIVGNNTHDWESIVNGCGCTGGGKFWDAHTVTITNNYVHDNLSVGLWADTNDSDFLVEGNYIANNQGQGLFYEISYNMIVRNNNFIGNAVESGPDNSSFPTAAIYLSESGGDSRVSGRTANIEIYNNKFTNNWAGVVLWENADRFCASPSNTSTGYCTIVNPLATLTSCGDPTGTGQVNVEPYYSDCRWKTQNVKVHNNIFSIDRASIPGCTVSSSCGYQGIFSNFGSSPTWSPYMGDVIEKNITLNQNNRFSNNAYLGDWNFIAEDQSNRFNFAIWQLDPYSQDIGSTYNGQSQYLVANALDEDTATLEGSIGKWTSWFNSTVSRSSAEAHGGTHSLQIDMTDPFWGIQTSNPADVSVTPANKQLSFWVKLGSGPAGMHTQMEVNWIGDGGLLRTDTLVSPALISSWQQATVNVVPPDGSKKASVVFRSSSGNVGSTIYLDDIVIADTP